MAAGFLKKPTIQARIHGLDRHYYSLVIDWRKNDLEEQILQSLNKKDWTAGLLVKVGRGKGYCVCLLSFSLHKP